MVKSLKTKECLLVKKLEHARKAIQKLVKGTTRLYHILSIGNESNDKRGFGDIDETNTPST